jgi:two-component system sensor histidine kinase/response regulator
MKRILVIEDEPSVRQIVVEALQTRGWQPVEAVDGEEGLDRALAELPDMILCDIQMPKMDGYGVLRGIRQNAGPLATVPFLFLTGHGDKPMMRQAMEMGADDFIVKPFTISELLAAVDARFQKQAIIAQSLEKKLDALRDSLRFALPHELVTPLNTILGFANLLVDGTTGRTEQVREYASHIKEAGERLRALIEKFLVFAQVELTITDSKQREAYTNRPPAPTEETVLTVAERVANENGRVPDLKFAVEAVEHRVAPSHLERLIRELVENACRFSPSGTPIQVRSGRPSERFELRVTDEGRGFTPDQIQQVSANIQFDRKLAEQQGSGLGLAICRRIAEIYGGSLEIESDGKTVVRVELPD